MVGQLKKRLFRDTINVQRISGVAVDERGIESQTWQAHLNNVVCKIDSSGTTESKGGRNTILENFTVYIHGDQDIKANDRFQSTSDNDVYYEIDGVRISRNRSGGVIGLVISCHLFD